MKQRIFTLLMMFALVIMAGSAMAQSTWNAPYVGSSYNYDVSGILATDNWTFLLGDASSDFTDLSETETTGATFISGKTGTGATTATANIKWTAAAVYRLWVKIDGTSCSNYRYMEITVTAYTVDFTVLAITAGDNYTTNSDITTPAGTATVTDCPGFVGEDFDVDGTTTEGNTYVYFKIVRTPSIVPTNVAWNFTPLATSTAATWEWSTDQAFGNTITLGNEVNVASGNNTVYVRATIANTLTSHDVALYIGVTGTSSTAYDVPGHINDVDNDDVLSTLTLNSLPAIGTFGTH